MWRAPPLATFQRELRRALKGDAPSLGVTDAYLARIERSPNLPLIREIAEWWRGFGIERYCPLTSALLKHRQAFHDETCIFMRKHPVLPYIEVLGKRLLEVMGQHPDPLQAALARFELALILVKAGDAAEYHVPWPQDPNATLAALLEGDDPTIETHAGTYLTIVSGQLPGLFTIVEQT